MLTSSFVKSFQEPATDTVPQNKKSSKRAVKRAQREMKEREDKVERKQRELQEAVEDMKKYQEEVNESVHINNEELNELIEQNEVNINNDLNLKYDIKLQDMQKLNHVELQKLQKQIELLELDKIKPLIDEKMKLQLQRQQDMLAGQADKIRAQHEKLMAAHPDIMVDQKMLLDVQAKQFKFQQKIFDSINKNFKLHNNIKVNAITFGGPSANDEMNDVLQFLQKNNVAKVSDITKVKLNEKELIVNDKKQPASLHEQLKKKYLNKTGDFITYLRQGDSIMISMQVHEQDPV